MKKILLFTVLLTMVIASCKKKVNNPSITVTASFPTITFTPTMYFSIPVGGALPSNIATAYDSFYKQTLSVILIDSGVHNLVPGLYTGVATAKSQYGYVTNATYYVAVTNISGTENLSGNWYQIPPLPGDSTATMVAQLANGFYSTSNVTGVNTVTDPADVTPAIFAVINDTTIQFGPSVAGTITSPTGTLNTTMHVLGDTSMTYATAAGTLTFYKN
jgi:hypothetical protein